MISLVKGTRDFNSIQLYKRNYIINKIKNKFNLFGFFPIETPAIESNDLLLNKYGNEGDKLIFRILNSGNFIKDINDISELHYRFLQSKITTKSLRYDLTVPLARYIINNLNNLHFPFKRYQIQNVWRADRPQKGRFREFCQCDADVVGADSLNYEIDFLKLYDLVFKDLDLLVNIKINHRKILLGLIDLLELNDLSDINKFYVILDKIDNIKIRGVLKELYNIGISDDKIILFNKILTEYNNILDVRRIFIDHGIKTNDGINDIDFIFDKINNIGLSNSNLNFDISLVRGLEYYTGTIFEVKSKLDRYNFSIGGGGRYDKLLSSFSSIDKSCVGISFGLDRIYLIMEELNLFPDFSKSCSCDILIINFSNIFIDKYFEILYLIRSFNISIDLYPNPIKLHKQINYALKKGINNLIFFGQDEYSNNTIILKKLNTKEQISLNINELHIKLKKLIY